MTLRVLAASSEKAGLAASSGVLFAVVNHHAEPTGAVLAVIPRLAPILRDGIDLAGARTLDVLLDLILLFVPEPGSSTSTHLPARAPSRTSSATRSPPPGIPGT